MNQFIKTINTFIQEEEGSQVVEYALIIAVVSIGLVTALSTAGLQTSFGGLVERVTACFSAAGCPVVK